MPLLPLLATAMFRHSRRRQQEQQGEAQEVPQHGQAVKMERLLLNLGGPWTKTKMRKKEREWWLIWEAATRTTRPSVVVVVVVVVVVLVAEWELELMPLDNRVIPLLSVQGPLLRTALKAAIVTAALAAARIAALVAVAAHSVAVTARILG